MYGFRIAHQFGVSNLLGFPASGELKRRVGPGVAFPGFQFIGFPSEWGVIMRKRKRRLSPVSNLLGFPASGETSMFIYSASENQFPIYWVPQRVGSCYA